MSDLGLNDDVTQRACAEHIDSFIKQQHFLKKILFNLPHGLYLYGGVGSGKTTLMNAMAQYIGRKGARFHMKAFMLKVHEKGIEPTVQSLGKIRFLFLDELEITDIADAMIIQRLFHALTKRRIAIVATSNTPIDLLYENGLHYDRFEPCVMWMRKHFMVFHFDQGIDYRQIQKALTLHEVTDKNDVQLTLLDKILPAIVTEDGGVCVCFSDLCDRPLGPVHYHDLTRKVDVLYIKKTPIFTEDNANSLRRFITLVDLMYDAQKRVVLLPNKPIAIDKSVKLPVERLTSRLHEMNIK